MKYSDRQRGVSLIELLVAVAILAVALTPLLSLFVQSLKVAEKSNKRTIALNLIRDMQEEIRSKAFVDPDTDDVSTWPLLAGGTNYFPNGTTATPFGLEEGTFSLTDTRQTKLDDADDYNGWCRGQDCLSCEDSSSTDGLCRDNSSLEAFDGTKYEGTGYPHYQGFTRLVEVSNIFPNISTGVAAGETRRGSEPRRHTMSLGYGSNRDDFKKFNFYDLRDEMVDDLSAGAQGKSRLKVVKVTVMYKGPTIPDFEMEDLALIVLPVGRGD